jgi:GDP-4-dehydro-6-deoxy-D-mannose reductase
MTNLITGSAGMMGSHLYEYLSRDTDKVIPTYYEPTLDSRDKIIRNFNIEMDVTNKNQIRKVLKKYEPEVIYHLAAQSRPEVSFRFPAKTFETNVIGTINILESCVELGLKPLFVNASSSAVYGNIDWTIPPQENVTCNPLSPYGSSKLAQEYVVKNYKQNHDIDYVNVRIFNCTGPRKINDFVSDICRRFVDNEFPIKVGNLKTVRSIVDVRDLVQGLILCQNLRNETINLGSDTSYKIEDILIKIIGNDIETIVDKSLFRPSDEPLILGNIDKAKNLLSWKPSISLEETISDTIKYWQNI